MGFYKLELVQPRHQGLLFPGHAKTNQAEAGPNLVCFTIPSTPDKMDAVSRGDQNGRHIVNFSSSYDNLSNVSAVSTVWSVLWIL